MKIDSNVALLVGGFYISSNNKWLIQYGLLCFLYPDYIQIVPFKFN